MILSEQDQRLRNMTDTELAWDALTLNGVRVERVEHPQQPIDPYKHAPDHRAEWYRRQLEKERGATK